MTMSDVISALALPPESRVERRIPKKLLVEHGAATAADKRQIQAGIGELQWLAALKPSNTGVPEYRDEMHEVVEIAVLSLVLRPDAKAARMTELVHRAIPYPLMLIASLAATQSENSWDGLPRPSSLTDGLGRPSHLDAPSISASSATASETCNLSLATKRFAQNEAGKVILDGPVITCSLAADAATPALVKNLLQSLALAAQPRGNLLALYQGWIACLEAFQAARLTGRFSLAPTAVEVAARRDALAAHGHVEREIAQLRAQAAREAQINRRVELNLTIKRLEAELAETVAQL